MLPAASDQVRGEVMRHGISVAAEGMPVHGATAGVAHAGFRGRAPDQHRGERSWGCHTRRHRAADTRTTARLRTPASSQTTSIPRPMTDAATPRHGPATRTP